MATAVVDLVATAIDAKMMCNPKIGSSFVSEKCFEHRLRAGRPPGKKLIWGRREYNHVIGLQAVGILSSLDVRESPTPFHITALRPPYSVHATEPPSPPPASAFSICIILSSSVERESIETLSSQPRQCRRMSLVILTL